MSPRLFLLLSLCALASACSRRDETGTLSVMGNGLTEVLPDTAKVLLRVVSTRASATEARDEAAAATQAVIGAVAAVPGVNPADITTLDISVAPQYSNIDNGTPNITGYQFMQRLQVKVSNITNDVLGSVIDTAVQAGGNLVQIDTIETELSPPLREEATNTARTQAVENAKNSAQVLAQAGGVTLGRIRTFTDSQVSPPTPVPYANPGPDAAAVPTPVNIGTTQVTTSVSITWAICTA